MQLDNTITLDNLFDDMTHPGVEAALATIKAENLNRMRCILTGAPYATIDESEIRLTLNAYAGDDIAMTADSLLDRWDLNLLAMCSKVGPAFMNRQQVTLSELAATDSSTGYARLLTFYMTRFFYSFDTFGKGMTSTRSIERMHFAIDWFDLFASLPKKDLQEAAFRFASDDGWLPLDQWKQLGLFHIRARKHGIMSPEFKEIRGWTLVPAAMPVTMESFNGLLDSLLVLLVRSTVLGMGPEAIASPNRDSLNVASLVADFLGIENLAVKQVSEPINPDNWALAVAEAAYQDSITGKKINVAWSAMNGPGHAMRAPTPKRAPKQAPKPKADKAIKVRVAKPRTEKAKKLNDLISRINFEIKL